MFGVVNGHFLIFLKIFCGLPFGHQRVACIFPLHLIYQKSLKPVFIGEKLIVLTTELVVDNFQKVWSTG
jgi:hypothetical protein